MFNKDGKLEKFKDAETIIGASVKVKGNFHGKGNIIIEGALEGSLKTDSNLFVGAEAQVVANVEAKDAIVNGEIRGNLKAKGYLAIGGTAKIFGDIQYGEISIEKGAVINGQLLALTDDHRRNEKKNPGQTEETTK